MEIRHNVTKRSPTPQPLLVHISFLKLVSSYCQQNRCGCKTVNSGHTKLHQCLSLRARKKPAEQENRPKNLRLYEKVTTPKVHLVSSNTASYNSSRTIGCRLLSPPSTPPHHTHKKKTELDLRQRHKQNDIHCTAELPQIYKSTKK